MLTNKETGEKLNKGDVGLKIKNYHIVLLVVGFAMGILLALQFKLVHAVPAQPEAATDQKAYSLVSEANEAREHRDALKEKSQQLRAELDKIAAGPELGTMKETMALYRIEAGLAAVSGPGVEVTLDDNNDPVQPNEGGGLSANLYLLHDEDILKVLNELKAAGAEVLAINGQRLLSTSEIQCVGPTILTNKNHRLTPPFVITAIGDATNMENSLKMRGGVVDNLKVWGIQVNIKKQAQITIPAYSGGLSFEYAQLAGEEEGSQ